MTNKMIKNKISRSLHSGIVKVIRDEITTIASLSKRYNLSQYSCTISAQTPKDRH